MIESGLTRHTQSSLPTNRVDRFSKQEGLISALWQSWSWFCREVTITSAQGAITSSGATTTSSFATNSEMEIAYVAKQLAHRRTVGTIRALVGSYQEPTWGDASKLNYVIIGLRLSNESNMVSAFGAVQRLTDLQICRNASAHINADNITKVNSARVRYNTTNFYHPSDMIFWIDPTTNDYVWKSWLDEIRDISNLAIS